MYSILCFDPKEVDVQRLCHDSIYRTLVKTFLCSCCTYSCSNKCVYFLLTCELLNVTVTRNKPTFCENTYFQLNVNATEVQTLNGY